MCVMRGFRSVAGDSPKSTRRRGRTFTFLILYHSTTGRPLYRLRKRRNGFGPAGPPTATLKTRICSRESFRASIRKHVISIAARKDSREQILVLSVAVGGPAGPNPF